MDILEFADEIEEYHGDMMSEVTATRIRQQQAENTEFQYLIERLNSIIRQKETEIEALKDHPVKELTDEDFMKIMRNRWDIEDYTPEFIFQLKEFAKAILKKANEK